MLGKILKYELKSSYKFIIPLYIAVLIVSGILKFQLSFYDTANDSPAQTLYNIGFTLTIFLFIMALAAASIISFVLLLVRFYKSMFGDEGYLTFTLPCKPDTIMNGKILNVYIWNMLLTITTIIAAIIVGFGDDFFSFFGDIISNLHEFIVDELQVAPVLIYVIFVIIFLLGALAKILKVVMCLCIGQLSNTHKILMAIVAYIATSIGISTFETILSLFGPFSPFSSFFRMLDYETTDIFYPILFTELGKDVLYVVVFYIVSHIIINKHLNLE